MDLIEVLWKQDVDLGYNPIMPALNPVQQQKEVENAKDEIEKLKALLELKTDKVKCMTFYLFLAPSFYFERLSERKISTETYFISSIFSFRMKKTKTIQWVILGPAYHTSLIPRQVS
jgi:hypothetical protein